MKCPFCSSENTRVIDSRPADDNNSIRPDGYAMNVGSASQHMRRLKRYRLS